VAAVSGKAGKLYVVATPIGNLEDISARALRVLAEVDLVLAEDTRHSGVLLRHYGISTRLESLHEHNERSKVPRLLERLRGGASMALISDAGTPLLSDPGYALVSGAHDAGIVPVPVPGPSAVIAALSVSGLPTDRFCFEGFLPARAPARRQRLTALVAVEQTLVFFESSHRVVASLRDMCDLFGAARHACLARELTKRYETVRRASLGELVDWIERDPEQHKGELVILVGGSDAPERASSTEEMRATMALLLEELPPARAARLAARLTGASRNELYRLARDLQGDAEKP